MSSDDGFLAAAEAIGRRIVREAVWHDGRCSWLGAVIDPDQPRRSEYRPLEPNLYDGAAGVGLFLAQLAAVTGDPATHRTAAAALRHAVGRAHDLDPARRDGFHAGTLGVAWAAAKGAELLGKEELRERARALATDAPPPARLGRCPDVILGSAGAILALVALADMLDEPAFVEDALETGEALIGAATVTRHGWSWAGPDRHPHHLCGLSHGAAGIGWALLEVFAATGDDRFATAARGAFDYERSWMDPRSGAWPDLRVGGQRRGAARTAGSAVAGTWCHGEGGIALTRLRASGVLGGDAVGADAERAVETTRRHLAEALPYELEDLTLCHGAAGSAEVLLCAGRTGPAKALGHAALDRHGDAGDWPCGAAGGTTPALFRGLSGIGWWFLRLHDRTIASPVSVPVSRLTRQRQRA